jgi:3-phenylpropionate/trans-cinnamate dioxygenase alpha subunit
VTPRELMPTRTAGAMSSAYVSFRQFANVEGHATGFSVGRNARRFAAHGASDVIDQYQDQMEPDVLARYGEDRAEIYRGSVQHANLFPNMSFLSSPQTLRVWHPKGPNKMEMYSWVYVDKDAPPEVKDELRWITQHHFGPQGLAEQDDGENFALIGSNLASRGSQINKLMLHYRMGLDDADESNRQDGIEGRLDSIGEMPQRLFYRRWLELMTESS